MQGVSDLLIEIGTEEMPPRSIKRLGDAFAAGFETQLAGARLRHEQISMFATPRRLALLVHGLIDRQPDIETVRKGPSVKAGFDQEGRPTKAALGFAQSCGVAVDALETEEGDKGRWLVYREARAGKPVQELVVDMAAAALGGLPVSKRMRWGDGDTEFVRPVQWVSMVYGEAPVSGTLLGQEIGATTRGHRFHAPDAIRIGRAGDYPDLLRREGYVEPSFEARRERIVQAVEGAAKQLGGQVRIEEDLLDEVTGLCEWPVAVAGSFDRSFLEVPPEVLVETMQGHQRYFPVFDADGKLLPNFITISNIESADPELVRSGNERVIRPRFADAAFFWRQDLGVPFESLGKRLESVVFQRDLGTIGDKTRNLVEIAGYIAERLGFDVGPVSRAATLSKCDLMTQMIFEFPSLQGTMGRYYAERGGEPACVSAAMEEQYLPRHAGDALPETDCGLALSIADKLYNLIGIFGVGLKPTGDKDPYALRRAAIGLLRILIETPLDLDLRDALAFAEARLGGRLKGANVASEVFDYCVERLRGYYAEARGVGADVIDAVIAVDVGNPSDIDRRIRALGSFIELPEAVALSAANKRIRNILRKSEAPADGSVAVDLLEKGAESELNQALDRAEMDVRPLLDARDYAGALRSLAGLREPVDRFFDEVMVMVEDPQVRENRIALLGRLANLFGEVADLSKLQQ